MSTTCSKCGKSIRIGYDAIWTPDGNVCDSCASVSRDVNGYAWHPREKKHTYVDVRTGELEVVTRAQAFGRNKEA